ncbi:hypothetical protein MSAN_01677600 [Mycena sanguinolenta]|uniref:Chromo domain-containing protein n=1 Tax=Mycena sanguinolenta TaxID=230812 RepID=A0A8H6XZE4_9AGAR|nr:hypothetical protein MSAN_01677600 [Mycena sanguinolenta]
MPKRAREPEESEPELWAVGNDSPCFDWPPKYRQYSENILGAQRTDEPLCKESSNPLSPSFGQGWEYLVKWDTYDISESTWEPITHLQHCQELLRKFWEDAGEEAMTTNIPNFEILVPSYVGSPIKKTKRYTSSQKSPRSRHRATGSESTSPALKIKIRRPIASTSTPQTSTNFTAREAPVTPPTPPSVPTPITPITPPPTPEPEPADYLEQSFISPSELDSAATPVLVANEDVVFSNVPDVYLTSWQPVDDAFGVQPPDIPVAAEENGPAGSSSLFAIGSDPDLVDLFLSTPSDIF